MELEQLSAEKPFGLSDVSLWPMDVASPWNEEYPRQKDLQSFPFPLLSAASKGLNRWCPVSQKKIQVSRNPSCPYWSDQGPKHHVCRHRSSWGTSISAWFWMGKPPKIHSNPPQASPSNMTQSPGWRLHWTTYICVHFFFENLIPVLWGSKHHPFNLITFLFRGVAIAIFLLDWLKKHVLVSLSNKGVK